MKTVASYIYCLYQYIQHLNEHYQGVDGSRELLWLLCFWRLFLVFPFSSLQTGHHSHVLAKLYTVEVCLCSYRLCVQIIHICNSIQLLVFFSWCVTKYSHSTYNLHACSAVITSPSVRKVSCSGCHHVISPLKNCPFCTIIDTGHQATWYKRKCRTNWLINHVFGPLSSILSQICDSDSRTFCMACLILRKVAVGLGFQRDQVLRTVRLCATDIRAVFYSCLQKSQLITTAENSLRQRELHLQSSQGSSPELQLHTLWGTMS